MYKNKHSKLIVLLAAAFMVLSFTPTLFAQNESNELPFYETTTGQLTLPLVTLSTNGAATSSYTDLVVKLNSVTVLAATLVNEVYTSQIVMGALAYNKFWSTEGGGLGTEPSYEAYTRCKACHGWDLLATAGGYVRRTDGGGTRAAAGNIRLDRTDYTAAQILNSGSWDPATDAPTSAHPSFVGILTTTQVDALVAYLNSRGAKFHNIGTVYNAPDPATYTVPFGDAAAGLTAYAAKCEMCHGTPDSTTAPIGPSGGISAFVAQDGKFSELAHKSIWGDPGNMSRAMMSNPTTQDMANIIAYLKSLQ